MIQIRIHGRGGQGVVTAAELLSLAAFHEGKFAQAFPSFGSERMGAPVMAFCRIDDQPIRSREPVYHPDGLLIQDSTLLHQVDVFKGINPEGMVLINSTRSLDELGLNDLNREQPDIRVMTLPASDLAMKHQGRPIANVALVAGYAAATGVMALSSLTQAITERFPGESGTLNARVADEAYHYMESLMTSSALTGKTEAKS